MSDTKKQLEIEADKVRVWAQGCYADQGPDYCIMPTWFGFTGKTVFIVASPWPDEEMKLRAVEMVSMLFAAYDVTHYILCSEVWIAEVNKDTDPLVAKMQPRHRQDKKEALQVMAVHKDGTVITRQMDISRADDGRAILGEPTDPFAAEKGGSVSGRMTNLLNVPPMPEAIKEAVKNMVSKTQVMTEVTLH